MERTRITQGQQIAGVGGGLLFIFLFLPWFGSTGTNLSGWEGQSTTDIYLMITALVAILAAVTAGGVVLPGMTINGATALLGSVGSILLLWLVIFDFPDGADRKIGLYLSLLAVLAIAYGGLRATREEVGGAEPAPRRRRPATDDPERTERSRRTEEF